MENPPYKGLQVQKYFESKSEGDGKNIRLIITRIMVTTKKVTTLRVKSVRK